MNSSPTTTRAHDNPDSKRFEVNRQMGMRNPPPPARPAARSEIVRVLLIEDNPGDARLLQEALAEAATIRFEMVLVSRAADALGLLDQHHFDVALLDLSLPDSQ